MKSELYVGLDVDKEWILIAVTQWGRNGAVQDLGVISNDLHALEKLLARLRKRYGPEVIMRACYEAGPCGFGIARRLKQLGARSDAVDDRSRGCGITGSKRFCCAMGIDTRAARPGTQRTNVTCAN
jgi:hypothetical protein